MDIIELKTIWESYDKKLEKSAQLNLHCIEMIQSQRVKSKLQGLLILRIIEVLAHLAVLYYLAKFFIANIFEIHFSLSSGVLLLFFTIACINGITQISLIKQIDYSENITAIQKKLTLLHSRIIDYLRLTFLVLPTYMAYPIIFFKILAGIDIVLLFNHNWWMGQLIFSAVAIGPCIWLYKAVSYKNLHKKWVRYIIEKSVGQSITKAMSFIHEIDEYKKGNV